MSDEEFMGLALGHAKTAGALGEVPVGAVVVWQGRVIATGNNCSVQSHDPTAHAEIVALRSAAQVLGNYRLDECELFVTLEPCAMCSGAILNARIKRVVFGAFEPKTGAAGSVINLFNQQQLNHQTGLLGGILAEPSRALIQDFFRQRRILQRALAAQQHPLRDDSLRTPDAAFEGLSGYPWTPRYQSDLVALDGLRMHYLDEQPMASGPECGQRTVTYLCLHGSLAWSYQFHKLVDCLLQAGHRLIAPDLIGFGKSDKPKKEAFHTLSRHCRILFELVEKLDLHHIVLVVPDQPDLVSLVGMMLPMHAPLRYRGLLTVNPSGLSHGIDIPIAYGALFWFQLTSLLTRNCASADNTDSQLQLDDETIRIYEAPFPGQSFRAGMRAFADLSKLLNATESLELRAQAEQFWHKNAGYQSSGFPQENSV